MWYVLHTLKNPDIIFYILLQSEYRRCWCVLQNYRQSKRVGLSDEAAPYVCSSYRFSAACREEAELRPRRGLFGQSCSLSLCGSWSYQPSSAIWSERDTSHENCTSREAQTRDLYECSYWNSTVWHRQQLGWALWVTTHGRSTGWRIHTFPSR